MPNYINYHSHSMYSNVSTPDVIIKNKDRVSRVAELKQSVFSGIEHGTLGNYFEVMELAKENNVKPLFGTEAYFVEDRIEKDSTNAHIILLAKNEIGRKNINRIISEANVTGYYYKPRVDMSLILSIPRGCVWITTACVGGIWKYGEEKSVQIFEKLFEHFQNDFFLEVQYHNTDKQKELNQKILKMSVKYGCQIIAGMDTHMINQSQSIERDIYLASRGIEYPDENGWYLDFPSYDEALSRFIEQGVLSKKQAEIALENTNIFNSVEEYKSVIFDKNKIKLPTLYPDKTQKEKNEIFSNLIWDKWNVEKYNVSEDLWGWYEDEIKKEEETVLATNISDYFLLDYEIVKRGIEKGGMITLTGRGSAPGFYTCKLLGFTTIDRISAEIKLYPERFISKERLLKTKSIPDIDFNLGEVQPFIEAQEEIIGKGHAYRMLSYQTVGESNAWKLYARYKGVSFDLANEVSNQIKQYEEDMKYAETDEDKEMIDIKDYIDEKYWEMYDNCQIYLKLIYALTQHPCGFLIFNDGLIEEEIGLIRTKDVICAAIDGKSAEKYLFLKNDWLKVDVVKTIYNSYARIGMKPDSVTELIQKTRGDSCVWDIYKNGITLGINQFETDKTTAKAKRYIPKNISESTSMVSAIRPGFKSLYSRYEKREPFSYGVSSLDEIIQTEQFPYSYLLYQEQVMSVLAYAGIPIHETYEVIKAIAKKRYAEVMKYREIFIPLMTNKLIDVEMLENEKADEISKNIWKVVEDSAFYSFNAAHALAVACDSLYGAYLKSHYPVEFYETIINIYEANGKKDKIQLAKNEASRFFGIKFPDFKFGMDDRTINGNAETKEIMMSLKTIKGFGGKVSDDMFELSKMFVSSNGSTFLDLLFLAEENGYLNKKFMQLILLNYFSDFGESRTLLEFYNEFTSGKNRYSSKLSQKSKDKRIIELKNAWQWIEHRSFPIWEQINNEVSVTERPYSRYDVDKMYVYVLEINTKSYHPIIKVQVLKNGNVLELKVKQNLYYEHHFQTGDILLAKELKRKNLKVKDENGKWIVTEDFEKYLYLNCWYRMSEKDEFIK